MKSIHLVLIAASVHVLCITPLRAQTDYDWWNMIHNWDGISPPHKYITISPAYMGPNALPVPQVRMGLVNPWFEVENAIDFYFSRGDNTQDWFARVNVPVVKGIVSLEGYVVPLEHFETDTTTRDTRAARTRSGEGYAGGDIYFSTHVQLWQGKKFPDAALELAMKTASGTHLTDARFTDASGYFFNLSVGKGRGFQESFVDSLRWFAMAGFYSFQTYDDFHLQNDAMLLGAGFSVSRKIFHWRNELGGYAGFHYNGDHPMVFRSRLSAASRLFRYELMYQKGLHDFPYTGLRLSLVFYLDIHKKATE